VDYEFDWNDTRPDSELSSEEIVQRNIAAVLVHFHNENPEHVEKAVAVYTDDIVWEVPARGILLRNTAEVIDAYRDLFASVVYEKVYHLRRFATEHYVVDDQVIYCTKVADKIPKHYFPVGAKLSVRLLHIFEMRDGRISREIAYEMWRERGSEVDFDDLIPTAEIEDFPPVDAITTK
jgi:ketosteroid isomerase-like protein